MNVQFLRFVDVFPYSIEQYGSEESLGDIGFAGDENSGGFVAGIGCP